MIKIEERISALEKQIESILYAYEQNQLFLQSDAEVKGVMTMLNKVMTQYMKDSHQRFNTIESKLNDLQEQLNQIKDI